MKQNINLRSAMLAVTLGVIGLILLLLVSGSFFDGSAGFELMIWLSSILPLILLATFVALVFGSTKNNKLSSANSRTHKILSALSVVSFAVGILATKASTLSIPYNQTRGQFVLENIGTAAIFIAFVFALALIDRQKYIYWPLWNSVDRKQADERQLFVRQRVFEKAYRYIIFLAIACVFVGFQASRMQKIAPFLVILAVLGMPAVVAAWQNDS